MIVMCPFMFRWGKKWSSFYTEIPFFLSKNNFTNMSFRHKCKMTYIVLAGNFMSFNGHGTSHIGHYSPYYSHLHHLIAIHVNLWPFASMVIVHHFMAIFGNSAEKKTFEWISIEHRLYRIPRPSNDVARRNPRVGVANSRRSLPMCCYRAQEIPYGAMRIGGEGNLRKGGKGALGSGPTANRANGQLAYLLRPYFRYMNWFPSKVRDASFPTVENV